MAAQSPHLVEAAADGVIVVAIGRNEGERLQRCLASASHTSKHIVYVDSGSTDESVSRARAAGSTVVNLDMTRPFTAARARNVGFAKALDLAPGVRFVQFVDGDCELELGWIAHAHAFLDEHPGVAAVFGRRRERFPHQTVYNRLCDLEWDVPPGPVKSCGGDVMIRVAAFRQVGGYRDTMIAGEEPELCVRLRQAGWTIQCLPQPMTIHDAAITSLSQWWRRAKRSGHAYAEGAALHGAPPEYHCVRECRRILFWGAGLPLTVCAAAALITPLLGGILALAYPAQIARLYLRHRQHTDFALPLAVFTVAGNFPEAMGIIKYHWDRLRGTGGRLIEYK